VRRRSSLRARRPRPPRGCAFIYIYIYIYYVCEMCACVRASISTYLRSEGCEAGGTAANRARRSEGDTGERGGGDSSGGLPGRNRMTERAQGTVGGDDCQNRAARRYEKCSYLWHYFRRFEPFFRPDPSPLPADAPLANRSPCPFFLSSPSPPLNHLRCVPLPPRSARRTRVVLTSSPRSAPLPDRRSAPLHTSRGGPTTGVLARTAGRYCLLPPPPRAPL